MDAGVQSLAVFAVEIKRLSRNFCGPKFVTLGRRAVRGFVLPAHAKKLLLRATLERTPLA
jgi:hypothetical protein